MNPWRAAFLLLGLLVVTPPPLLYAQPPPSDREAPPVRRWLELQTLNISTRYRFVQNSADVVTSNQWQYKDVLRGRFNLDREHRYTINFGLSSGLNFIGSWNNTGVGVGSPDAFVTNHYLRQLFGAAIPVRGVEVQFGGLYISRGESTEITTYDDDGYVFGGRASVRRPERLFFDEITATRGLIGPFNTPSLTERWAKLGQANYHHFLVAKRVGKLVRTSADYTHDQQGADAFRGAVAIVLESPKPFNTLRYEMYVRTSVDPASGFAFTAERLIAKRLRTQVGYTTIDALYGGWNADRIQRGRRFFGTAALPLNDDFTLLFFATQALHTSYSVANRTRFDAVITYDLLHTLRRARVL